MEVPVLPVLTQNARTHHSRLKDHPLVPSPTPSTHLAIVEDLIHVVVEVLSGVAFRVHQVATLLQVGDEHEVTLQDTSTAPLTHMQP